MSQENILVTGFGPFGKHKINASWESVKLLPQEIDGYKIITHEIPVSYDTVDKQIQELWNQYCPKLVIHVGVSEYTDRLTLELCAHQNGYLRQDYFGNCPKSGHKCPSKCSKDVIYSNLNLKAICDEINEKPVKAKVSDNAGRYLCEYIFYTSLDMDSDKALFIHVPPLDTPYSARELANGIEDVIKCALKQCNCA